MQERRAEMDVSYYHQVLTLAGKVASRSLRHRDCGKTKCGKGWIDSYT